MFEFNQAHTLLCNPISRLPCNCSIYPKAQSTLYIVCNYYSECNMYTCRQCSAIFSNGNHSSWTVLMNESVKGSLCCCSCTSPVFAVSDPWQYVPCSNYSLRITRPLFSSSATDHRAFLVLHYSQFLFIFRVGYTAVPQNIIRHSAIGHHSSQPTRAISHEHCVQWRVINPWSIRRFNTHNHKEKCVLIFPSRKCPKAKVCYVIWLWSKTLSLNK